MSKIKQVLCIQIFFVLLDDRCSQASLINDLIKLFKWRINNEN